MSQHPQRKPLALVTGASAGIGAAFARELAARGHDLVLVARRRERLEALAAELQARHGTTSTILAADLNQPQAPREIVEALQARGLAVDVLVNNAGYGVPGFLLDQDWPVHRDFMQIMATAPVELAWRLLPGMLARGHGRILNIASVAGLIPGTAGHTLYAAAKAFLIKFSQSLALEYRDRGVHTCAVCAGFTLTEFHDVNGARPLMNRMPKWIWLQADRVARDALDAVERGKVVQISGLLYKTVHLLTRWMPDWLQLRLSARRSRHFRVQGGTD